MHRKKVDGDSPTKQDGRKLTWPAAIMSWATAEARAVRGQPDRRPQPCRPASSATALTTRMLLAWTELVSLQVRPTCLSETERNRRPTTDLVRRSKTDGEGAGRRSSGSRARGPSPCSRAVGLGTAHRISRGTAVPLGFAQERTDRRAAPSRDQVPRILKAMALEAGLPEAVAEQRTVPVVDQRARRRSFQ